MNGSLRIETRIENKTFDAQLKNLESKLSKEEKKLNDFLTLKPDKEKAKQDISKLIDQQAVKVEKIKNQIVSLQKAKSKLEQTKNFNFEGSLNNSLNSAKKLVSGIFKIASAYALIGKASSAYLATDSNTTKQIETNWIGLGTILEPAIKFIADLMKKAVTSVLYFLSVLTGTDYIARANTNALKKQTNATKELAKANEKAIYSFDEMNIQNTNKSDNSSSIDDGIMSSLFDINDVSESTRKSIEKVANALKPIYSMIKEIIGWALDNPEVIMGILGGAGLLKMLLNVIGVAGVGGAGTGLAGIYGILLAIASIGVITICIKTIIDDGINLYKETENSKNIMKSNEKKATELSKKIKDLSKQYESGSIQIDTYHNSMKTLANSSLEMLDIYSDEYTSMNTLDRMVGSLTGRTNSIMVATRSYSKEAFAEITTMNDLYRQGKLNDEQTQDYIDTLLYYIEVVGQGGTSTTELMNTFHLNRKEAELLNNQYQTVSSMLMDVYFNSDKATNSFSWLNNVMKMIPKFVQTKIESNVKDSINFAEQFTEKINKIPLFKKVNIETNITANDTSARNTLNGLLSKMTSTISNVTSAFGIKINIPKLAVGGIVNNPGKGVPVGSAITGEAGKEGVLPLTNASTMAELGHEIGKWITVNTTLNNYMDGRLMQRHVSKIQQDKLFATNGRG